MAGKSKKEDLSSKDKELLQLENKRKKDMAKYIGNNIHKYRTASNLTREQLAEKSNLTASHIYQLEIGNSVPSLITTVDICNSLNISISQLVDDLLYEDITKFIDSIAKNFNNNTCSGNRKILMNQCIRDCFP